MGFVNFRLEERLGQSNTAGVITELGIGNFKAFGETQRVPIKPLTLIFGANCSGKSSILHGLLLAHHGMETGEYDAHQTKLAGEMVDLGGFAKYVHKHDATRAVTLRFEVIVNPQSLYESLDGKGLEREPFCGFSRLGLSLRLTGREPALDGIEVHIDDQPMLAFSRSELGRFRPGMVGDSHPYFARLVKSLMELKRLQDLPSRYDLDAPELQEREEKAKQIRELFRNGQAPIDIERVDFQKEFAEDLACRQFSFKRFVLLDEGPDGKGQERFEWVGLENNGPLEFYKDIYGHDKEGPGGWCSAGAS